MFQEFQKFVLRGNVMDLAVGVIIGGAFGKIVDSVVNDLIMPVVGIVFKADFSNMYIALANFEKVKEGMSLVDARKVAPVFAYGSFITIVLNFVILAFIIFMMIKAINALHKKQEAAPAPTPPQEVLLSEIRDLLKNQAK
jgi:large conductance mechanosensitive channel